MPVKPTHGSERRATGPRTPEGRKRAAQNALRHGLNASSPDDPGIAAQLKDWTTCAAVEMVPRAALIVLAEARCQVARVRAHQASLLEQLSEPIGFEVERLNGVDQPAQVDHAALVQQYQLSLRYRAEAEARARKAVQRIATYMTSHNATERTQDGAQGNET